MRGGVCLLLSLSPHAPCGVVPTQGRHHDAVRLCCPCSVPSYVCVCAAWAQVRAHVEQQIGLIAEGKAQKDAVVRHMLEQFRQK
jgi:hypothetical protein